MLVRDSRADQFDPIPAGWLLPRRRASEVPPLPPRQLADRWQDQGSHWTRSPTLRVHRPIHAPLQLDEHYDNDEATPPPTIVEVRHQARRGDWTSQVLMLRSSVHLIRTSRSEMHDFVTSGCLEVEDQQQVKSCHYERHKRGQIKCPAATVQDSIVNKTFIVFS